MQWKAAALVAAMAAGAMLCFGGPASALTNLAANPNFDLAGPHAQAAPVDRTFTPAATGPDLFVAPAPGYGASANSGADLSDDALGQTLFTPPGRTDGIGFGLPDVWVLLILGVAMIGLAARRTALAAGGTTWGRPLARRYSRNFSIFNYYTQDD